MTDDFHQRFHRAVSGQEAELESQDKFARRSLELIMQQVFRDSRRIPSDHDPNSWFNQNIQTGWWVEARRVREFNFLAILDWKINHPVRIMMEEVLANSGGGIPTALIFKVAGEGVWVMCNSGPPQGIDGIRMSGLFVYDSSPRRTIPVVTVLGFDKFISILRSNLT